MDSRTTTQRQAGTQRASPEKENSRCFNCHSLGHFSTECPQPQMLLCYNCRELGHKTFECTKNLSCRGCGTAGHKERQCPQATTHRPPQVLKGVDMEVTVGLSSRRPDPRSAPEEADAARPGDGLLRLPQQPPVWRPTKKQQPPPLPPLSLPAPPIEFQDFISSVVENVLSESGIPLPSNEMSLPPPPLPPFLPDPARSSSPARSAPEMGIEEEDLKKSRTRRDSSLQRLEKATRHLSFAAGTRNRVDVAESDRLEPLSRSRAGSSNTRMSTSWVEDETEWDGATMSFDNRFRQQSFCFDLLGRRAPSRHNPSSLSSMFPQGDITIVTGTSSTQIDYSWPVKESRTQLPNEHASSYQPSTNVVGRAMWLINPALLFQAEPVPPRSEWDDDCCPVPPRPPTLAVSAPLDTALVSTTSPRAPPC